VLKHNGRVIFGTQSKSMKFGTYVSAHARPILIGLAGQYMLRWDIQQQIKGERYSVSVYSCVSSLHILSVCGSVWTDPIETWHCNFHNIICYDPRFLGTLFGICYWKEVEQGLIKAKTDCFYCFVGQNLWCYLINIKFALCEQQVVDLMEYTCGGCKWYALWSKTWYDR